MGNADKEAFARRIFNQLMGLLNITEDIWLLGVTSHKEIINRLDDYHTDIIMITSSFAMNGIITQSVQNAIIVDTTLAIQNASLLIEKETFIRLRTILVELKTVMDEKMGEY